MTDRSCIFTAKERKAKYQETLEYFRSRISPDQKMWGEVTRVAPSGMSRRIRVFMVNVNGDIDDISRRVSIINDDPVYDDGIRVGGTGMDMVFDTIYRFWTALFPDLHYTEYDHNWRSL